MAGGVLRQYPSLHEIYEDSNVNRIDLLKIDAQGYELEVLKGGDKALKEIRIILCEVLFFKHYENQASFEEIYIYLKSKGFMMWCIFGWIIDDNGRPLQCDAIFINSNHPDAMMRASTMCRFVAI